MQIKHEIYLTFIIIVNLFLYNCAGSSSEVIDPGKSNQSQIESNKVKVSVEQQKNKIIELESVINDLNSRIEYQENMLSALSDEFKDKANFYYADIDEKAINSASAAAVRGVPTVVVYKKGVEVARKVGGLPEQQMRDFLKENL